MDHWINGEKSKFVYAGSYTYSNSLSDPLTFGGGFNGYVRSI